MKPPTSADTAYAASVCVQAAMPWDDSGGLVGSLGPETPAAAGEAAAADDSAAAVIEEGGGGGGGSGSARQLRGGQEWTVDWEVRRAK